MTVVITPAIRQLAGLLVETFTETRNADSIVDHDLAREAAMAYADSIVIVLRGGVDASEGQKDSVELAEDLLSTLDTEWEITRAAGARDLKSLVRERQCLREAVLDRLKQTVDTNETAAEKLAQQAQERALRLELARPIIRRFALAAHRWLTGESEMGRFAAEQRAETLADVLVGLLPVDYCVDPMRSAQNVRNDMKSRGLTFSPNDVIERINEALR